MRKAAVAAANYKQVALTFAPDYQLTWVLDQILGAGTVSGWAKQENTVYRNHHWQFNAIQDENQRVW